MQSLVDGDYPEDMNPRIRILTATELGWQRYYGADKTKGNVWERPDGTIIAVPGSAEPQATIVDYEWESFRGPWSGLSQWVLNWKLDDDKEMA